MDDAEHQCHSMQQVALLRQLSQKPRLLPREALYLATQLVNHGVQGMDDFLRSLHQQFPSKPAQDYLARLALRNRAIQSLPALKSLRADPQILHQLYERDGFVFRPGSSRPDVAIVIFTTKFNNFSFSNLVGDAIFSQLGVSRLVLKDTSEYLYFRGVRGLAASLADLPAAIGELLRSRGVRHAIITGYSSSGYASLYTAMRLDCLGYIGFSVATDISPQTLLPPYSMYEKLRGEVDPSLFGNLRGSLEAHPEMPCILHYGQRDPVDRAHAEYVADLQNVTLVCHDSADHQVTVHLLEEGRFAEPFVQLLERKAYND